MNAPRLLAALVAAGLMLTGCSAAATPSPSPTGVAESATPSATLEAPQASTINLSLQGLAVLDQSGAELRAASFDDPDATLSLVSDLLGSTPEPVDNRQFGMFYEWPEITVVVNFGTSSVIVTSPTLAGIPIGTSQGVGVGSPRGNLEALAAVVEPYDGDGDGLPDTFGIEAVEVPGTESLTRPGQPGIAYVGVTAGVQQVTSMRAPSGDYLDI